MKGGHVDYISYCDKCPMGSEVDAWVELGTRISNYLYGVFTLVLHYSVADFLDPARVIIMSSDTVHKAQKKIY